MLIRIEHGHGFAREAKPLQWFQERSCLWRNVTAGPTAVAEDRDCT